MKFWLLIVVAAIVSSGELYAKKVPQKIAVLRFTIVGEPDEFEYLSKSIPQHLEIAIDKEENVLVIREYLWKKIYNKGELDSSTLKNVVNLGLKANLDGVITGILQYNQNDIKLIINVVEISKGESIFEKTVSLPKSPAIIDSIKKVVTEVAGVINNKFPRKDPAIIKKERKRVKKIFTDVSVKRYCISIGLGAIYDIGTLERFPAKGVEFTNSYSNYYNQNDEEELNYDYMGSGFSFNVNYRFRYIEFGLRSAYVYNHLRKNKGNIMIFNSGMDINVHFLKRNIFQFISGYDFYVANFKANTFDLNGDYVSVDGSLKYITFYIGLLIKPVKFFYFGCNVGSSVLSWVNIQGMGIENTRPRRDPSVSIMYGFNFSSRITMEMKFVMQDTGVRMEIEGDDGDESFKLRRGFITLGIQYKIEWDRKNAKKE